MMVSHKNGGGNAVARLAEKKVPVAKAITAGTRFASIDGGGFSLAATGWQAMAFKKAPPWWAGRWIVLATRCLVEEVFQFFPAAGMAETVKGLLFDLANPFAGNIESFAYLFQGVFGVFADPEA